MAEWITCIECKEKCRAFFCICPRCKAQNHNSYKTVVNNQHSKNILHGKAKKTISCLLIGIILCSSVFFFILPSFVVPSPPLTALKAYALNKINQDRERFGLPHVVIDNDNATAQTQANELLNTQALSHWTTDGMKPYMRYSVYGGHDNVVQNVAEEKYGFVSLSLWTNNDQATFQ